MSTWMPEPVGHEIFGHAWAQHVVAAAVEADHLGAERDRRLELLVDDGAELAAADREVRVADRLACRRGETEGDEVRPAAHAAVGKLVADALGEAVADRRIGVEHASTLARRMPRHPRWKRQDDRAPHRRPCSRRGSL
jgi:hypothetical protein